MSENRKPVEDENAGSMENENTQLEGKEMQPGGVQSGELHPGELRSGELHPGELRSGELHPGEMHPGELQSGGNGDGWQVPKQEKNNWKKELWEWLKIIVSATAIAFVLNTFIIANSRVPSGSMENTIMTGDRVIGSRLTYKFFDDPQRGDIVIFRFPDNEKIYYVKRIIGLPGETVDIVDGRVYIDGDETPLEEPYIREPMVPEPPMHFEVPQDSYFMLGDNRNYSADARRWKNTYVKREKIIAKVLFRYFPKPGKIE